MSVLFGLLLIPFGAIHFLPTIIAALRNGRSVVGIFLLNLLLGWTVIGWIIALIWALRDEPKYVMVYPAPTGYRRY
jgi:Superinfection immunity protein